MRKSMLIIRDTNKNGDLISDIAFHADMGHLIFDALCSYMKTFVPASHFGSYKWDESPIREIGIGITPDLAAEWAIDFIMEHQDIKNG